jgi:hypothetical protein
MRFVLAGTELSISRSPSGSLGVSAVARLPGSVRSTGSEAVVVVTDAAPAAATVLAALLFAC